MELIIVKELGNGYVNLTAEKDYELFSLLLNQVVSEAVIKQEKINQFTAIKK